MVFKPAPGLGELLRRLVELTDGAASAWYRAQGLDYRPRYTPIMRALENGSATVSELQASLAVTQGAVSQTLKLMLADGLVERHRGEDARQVLISLTRKGRKLLAQLKPHWEATFEAVDTLEQEMQLPLVASLTGAVEALRERSFTERIADARARAAEGSAAQTGSNPFQSGGDLYAKFRPGYPADLAQSLAALCPVTDMAVDLGCGSGQLTSLLSRHFGQVFGIDPSESQLEHAERAGNIEYRARSAEDTGLPDGCANLITVAQAAHWFDLQRFYREVRRIARPGALIALVSYGVPYIEDAVNAVFQKGYWQDVHEFWPPERAHVESGYAKLHFPFPLTPVAAHDCRAELTLEQFIAYITTWSAYGEACKRGQQHAFDRFFETLARAWQGGSAKMVVWPIAMKVGRIG